jgi:hypothetical protein
MGIWKSLSDTQITANIRVKNKLRAGLPARSFQILLMDERENIPVFDERGLLP